MISSNEYLNRILCYNDTMSILCSHEQFLLVILSLHIQPFTMSLNTMGFAVVEFVDDCSVDVVPCNWLADNDKACFWPPFRSTQLISSVKKCAVPQPSWKKCAVRVMHLYG